MSRRKSVEHAVARRRAAAALMQATVPGMAVAAALAPPDRGDVATAGSDYVPESQHDAPNVAHVFLPFESLPRFPGQRFTYPGEATLLQGAANTVLASFTVPSVSNGVLDRWGLWCTAGPAGMLAIGTQLRLDVDGLNVLGTQTPDGVAVTGAYLFPDQTIEVPYLRFIYPLYSGQFVQVILNRVGSVDPLPYTYRTHVLGSYWPVTRRRRF